MKEEFKPDFGLYFKELFPDADVFYFLNLSIKEIFRIENKAYSISPSYTFEGVEYALSLDFPLEGLPDLIKLIEPYFGVSDFAKLIDQLIDPDFKYSVAGWDEPIDSICCTAFLGKEERNSNEKYIPFMVKEFY